MSHLFLWLCVLTAPLVRAGLDEITIMSPINNTRSAVLYPAITTAVPLTYHCSDVSAVVCLEVHEIGTGAVLVSTCIPCSQNDHVLNNVGIGDYDIILNIDRDVDPHHVLHRFHVVDVESGLPSIVVPREVELLASAPLFTGDISLQYQLSNAAMNVAKQIEVCIEMENSETGSLVLSQSCVRSDHNIIGLNGIAEGDYVLTFFLRMAHAPFEIYDSTKTATIVRIHRSAAFEPTYSWQRVHAWETIPTGLEVRLPIGETGGQKVAKIPEPWRLQLPLPSPCKYFLRMDIHKHTTASDIVNAAARRCEMDANCFELIVADIETPYEEMGNITSEFLGLFQNEVAIEFLPNCQKSQEETPLVKLDE